MQSGAVSCTEDKEKEQMSNPLEALARAFQRPVHPNPTRTNQARCRFKLCSRLPVQVYERFSSKIEILTNLDQDSEKDGKKNDLNRFMFQFS